MIRLYWGDLCKSTGIPNFIRYNDQFSGVCKLIKPPIWMDDSSIITLIITLCRTVISRRVTFGGTNQTTSTLWRALISRRVTFWVSMSVDEDSLKALISRRVTFWVTNQPTSTLEEPQRLWRSTCLGVYLPLGRTKRKSFVGGKSHLENIVSTSSLSFPYRILPAVASL
jgi:hypothetical protein